MKKLNNKGFGHLELIVIIVAVALIAGVGFFVYQNHSSTKKTTAHAGGWTNIGSANLTYFNGNFATRVSIIACASPVKWGNTPGWKVDWGYTSSNPSALIGNVSYFSNGTTTGEYTTTSNSGNWYITPSKLLPENNSDFISGWLYPDQGKGSSANSITINVGGPGLWSGFGTPQASLNIGGTYISNKVNLANC